MNPDRLAYLRRLAARYYDFDGERVVMDATTPVLTDDERRDMIAFTVEVDGPEFGRPDARDIYIAGMFAGSVSRAERMAEHRRWLAGQADKRKARADAERAERQARQDADRAERKAAGDRAELDRVQKALDEKFAKEQARRDFEAGQRDLEAHRAQKKEADESLAEFRRQLRLNHTRPRKQTEAEIRQEMIERKKRSRS